MQGMAARFPISHGSALVENGAFSSPSCSSPSFLLPIQLALSTKEDVPICLFKIPPPPLLDQEHVTKIFNSSRYACVSLLLAESYFIINHTGFTQEREEETAYVVGQKTQGIQLLLLSTQSSKSSTLQNIIIVRSKQFGFIHCAWLSKLKLRTQRCLDKKLKDFLERMFPKK